MLEKLIAKLVKEVKIKKLPASYCKRTNISWKYFSDAFSVEVDWEVFDKWDIWICYAWKRQTKINIAHELSHHFWHSRLTEKEQNKWIQLFKKSWDDSFAREYGKTNYKEDFATVFEFIYQEKVASDEVLKEKVNYLNILIQNN